MSAKELTELLQLLYVGIPDIRKYQISVLRKVCQRLGLKSELDRPSKADYVKLLYHHYESVLRPEIKRRRAEAQPPQLHCVRCHDTFLFDSPYGCVIPHAFDGEAWRRDDEKGRDERGEPVFRIPSACCGEAKFMTEVGVGRSEYWLDGAQGACFRGRHTTEVGAVAGNGVNVLPCKKGRDGECKRECLRRARQPVFVGNYDRW